MKKYNKYESHIKLNAVIIYILAALLCVGMIYYIHNVKKTLDAQKENINNKETLLLQTNILIEKINEMQFYSNQYFMSNDIKQLNKLNQTLDSINIIKDKILVNSPDKDNKETLDEITNLLNHKQMITKEFSTYVNNFNPYNEIYKIIENYQPHDSKVVKTTHDTLVYKTEKKGLLKRIGYVFNPDKYTDSTIMLSKTTVDTIDKVENKDINLLLNEIQLLTKKERNEYVKEIRNIETNYSKLIEADNAITKEIYELLILLHKQTLDSVTEEIQKSDEIINKNILFAIIAAGIALVIILTFIILIFFNIKKVTDARKATEEAKKKTEEIMESRHKLLLSVSHDIKTPLSSILGNIELMEIENENSGNKISSIKSSAEHILSLLSNLLNYSRLDQGKESPILSDFNINKLCDELILMFEPLAQNKKLSFSYKINIEKDIYITSDALKIKQILSNLLSNAIKYTVKGNVSFCAEISDNQLIFNINDEGMGIPEDKIDDIFKAFKRIDNNESLIEGSGFGLFVVKGLVELLNGEISVVSELGKGSHFKVMIPISFYKKTIDTDINQDITTSSKKNILIIDDDDTLLTVLKSMLNKLNHQCDICNSPIEFEEYCKRIDDYDIILTDREMGAFNGIDVLNKIKEINPKKKVVLMTARSEYNREVAVIEGFDDYLRKPFFLKDIAYLIKENIVVDEDKKSVSKYAEDFPDLCSMFNNDDTEIENILRMFIETTSDNLMSLNKAIDETDFDETIRLSHKMYPMFKQLNRNDLSDFLHTMDQLRGKEESSYPNWKEDSINFMNKVDDFISYLTDEYNIG